MTAKRPEGYTTGRPTSYSEEYCEIAQDYLSQGKSIIQLARHIGVASKTIYNWANANPEFLRALDIGKEYSQAFWEDELIEMMRAKDVNAPLVKLYFANRFNWHDKKEVDVYQDGAQDLNITFEVAEPVSDVMVTNAKTK